MVDGLLNRPEGANAADIRNELQDSMLDLAFVVRTEESLRKMQEILGSLRERFDHVYVQDTGKMFNTELMEVVELGFLLDVRRRARGGGARPRREPGRPLPRGPPAARRRQLAQALAGVPGRRRIDPARVQAREDWDPTYPWNGSTDGRDRLGRARRDPRGLGPARRRRGPQGHPHAQDPPLQPRGPRRGVVVGRVRDHRPTPTTGCSTRCTRSSGTTTGRWRSDARARTASAVRTR